VIVVWVCLSVAVAAAIVTALVTARWPALDPAAPHLSARTVAHEIHAHPGLRDALRRHVDPQGVMGALLSIALVVVALALTAFGALLAMVETDSGLARLDASAAQWGADNASDTSTDVLRTISKLGGTEWGVVLLVVVGLIEMRRSRSLVAFAFLVATAGGALLIMNAAKWIVGRERPDVDQLTGYAGASFPSGHATQAAALFAAFALLLGRRRSRVVRAVLAGAAVAVAVSVAATRVLLGVHWVTDVLAGLAVGWGWFALMSIAFGGRWLHFGAAVEVAETMVDAEDRTASGARSARGARPQH
jgi:membrane-associated phospholipid phosphatase